MKNKFLSVEKKGQSKNCLIRKGMMACNIGLLALFLGFVVFSNGVYGQCVDPLLHADSCDFDGDGVINIDDLDDDNDGILDSIECGVGVVDFSVSMLAGQNVILDNGDVLRITSGTIQGPSGSSASGDALGNLRLADAGNTFPVTTDYSLGGIYNLNFALPTKVVVSHLTATIAGFNGITNGSDELRISSDEQVTVSDPDGQLIIQSQGPNFVEFRPSSNGVLLPGDGTWSITIEDALQFTIQGSGDQATGVNIQVSLCADTDGDGIANYLDIDSDNDGCNDAVEAGHIDFDGDGEVDGSGSHAVTGQVKGAVTSYTGTLPAVKDANDATACCNVSVSGHPDNDNDGVSDNCDLDNDNDGILDVNEISSLQYLNSGFSNGLTSWNAVNVASEVDAAVVNLARVAATLSQEITCPNPIVRSFSFDVGWNNGSGGGATDSSVLRVTFGGTQYLSITTPLGGGSNTDNAPAQGGDAIVSALNGATFVIDNPSNQGPQFIDHSPYKNWNYVTVTVTLPSAILSSEIQIDVNSLIDDFGIDNILIVDGFCRIDTDEDNILNHLDIDSDGDGCNDAVEAGHIDFDGDGEVDGSGYDAVTGQVTGAVTSYTGTLPAVIDANDAIACGDVSASGHPDLDNDGVSDDYDLDNDNDGILDSNEINCNTTPLNLSGINPFLQYAINNRALLAGNTFNGTAINPLNALTHRGDGNGGLGLTSNSGRPEAYRIDFKNPVILRIDQTLASQWFDELDSITIESVGSPLIVSTPVISDPLINDINNLDGDNNLTTGPELNNVTGDGTNIVGFRPNLAGGNISPANSEWSITSDGYVTSVIVTLISNGSSSGVRLSTLCTKIDTDGDNIMNDLDIDSDNDGCPDAIEGAGNFNISHISNDTLTGGVDADGVPAIAMGGQDATAAYSDDLDSTACDLSTITDTLVFSPNGSTVDTCLAQDELPGSTFTYSTCGNPVNGILTETSDTCFSYTPITNGIDTACIVICDEYGICDTTVMIFLPEIITNDTLVTTDTAFCLDTNKLVGAPVDSITTCDGSGTTSGGGSVVIDEATGCVTTSPDFTNGNITDTTCIVICKNVAGVVVCDTTMVVSVQPSTTDTIAVLSDGSPVDTCLGQDELPGSQFTYTNCGNPTYGILNVTNDTCFSYTPLSNGIDTTCVIICDENDICDTTVMIFVSTADITNDTLVTTDTAFCLDTNNVLSGAPVDSITTCDGSGTTSGGGSVVIDESTGCVTTSPDFTNGNLTDTTCIVVCKTIAGVVVCDTTMLVSVEVPETDTMAILSTGAVDTCLSQNDLPGSDFTYTSCGSPINGLLTVTDDTCFSYTPITNGIDTACIVICDENGICDTTVMIFVSEVIENDTIVTTDTAFCLDTNNTLSGVPVDSITTCDGSGTTSGGGSVVIDESTGCVTTSPDFTNGNLTDTTCIVVCKTIAGVVVCDTTMLVSVEVPETDTMAILSTGAVDTCLSQNDLPGSDFTYTSCGSPINGLLTVTDDTCFSYTPITNGIDTACIVICDENGICDTTVMIFVSEVIENDTIVTTDTAFCLDTNNTLSGVPVDSITTCDGSGTTSGGGSVVIDESTGCVTTSPDFTNGNLTDTTCIVVCKTIAGVVVCDTTMLVSVEVPETDTMAILSTGAVDTCLSQNDLPGSDFTYTSCGSPINGLLTVTDDTCFSYTPITNGIDTACIVICDENGICDTTVMIFVSEVIENDTIVTTDTAFCLDTNNTLSGVPVDSITTCDGSGTTSGGGSVVIDESTGCVTTSPDFTNGNLTDTTCIVVCKTIAGVVVCDTTMLVSVEVPETDTMAILSTGAVDTCLSQNDLPGSDFTYTSCGNPINGLLTVTDDTCFSYTPITNGIDTACIVICDENGICDTTVMIFVSEVIENDTIVTTDTAFCLDTNNTLSGVPVDSITTCDGSGTTSGGGSVVIDESTGCVTTSPDFTNGNITDTTCIVVCKTIAGVVVCDTTMLVSVEVPETDTMAILSTGAVDTCLSQNDLPGSDFTYTSCGNPINGLLTVTDDTCFSYTPITNGIDTACIVICDENGICDTTVMIFVSEVIENDTIVTTDTAFCLDTNNTLSGVPVDSITTCDGSGTTSGGGSVVIDESTGCVTTSPDFTNGNITDTTCIVVCKTIAGVVVCDTTMLVSVEVPETDTMAILSTGAVDTCLSQNDLPGSDFTYTSCGSPINGLLTVTDDTCFSYTPITNGIDTACIVICDENGICDTTVMIFVSEVIENDTIVTTDTAFCLDTNNTLSGVPVDSITTCDGSGTTSGGGSVVIDESTGCVTTSPDFTNGNLTDTTCIVVCKTIAGVVVCDTTMLVSVEVPETDTMAILSTGAVDTCLSQNDLPGSDFTYTSCGSPINGLLTVTDDTCFSYTPITNGIDTACIVICDENGICDTTVMIFVSEVIENDTIVTTDTAFCLDTNNTLSGVPVDSITTCDGSGTTSGGGSVVIDESTGCVTTSPDFTNGNITDTTCIVICKNVAGVVVCDTTIVVSVQPSTTDTMAILSDGSLVETCLGQDELPGSEFTYTNCGNPNYGVLTLTNDTCFSYMPVNNGIDTTCVIICDEYGICDTTVMIFVSTADITNDTLVTTDTAFCLDTNKLVGAPVDSITTCDGSGTTSGGGSVVIDESTGCVTTSPDFTNGNITDTTCIVVCKNVAGLVICDTTMLVSVQPPTKDTVAAQLSAGGLGSICLNQDQLLGSEFTYTNCGNPTKGVLAVTNDTCFSYIPIIKSIDTACIIVCDEYGICDTTIAIFVPLPTSDTMFVQTIPNANSDTCVVLESSFMAGDTVLTCDGTGTTSGGVSLTITGLCVSYPVPGPVFTGDTACIIVCDTIHGLIVCDTTMIVYVPDTIVPTIICKNNTVYLDSLGLVTVTTDDVLDTIYDNTLIHSVTFSAPTFDCSDAGTQISVTVIVSDTNRNTDSCMSMLTVLDTTAPVVICQDITLQLDSNGTASIVALDIDAGSSDNCAIATIVIDQTTFDCSHVGTNLVTLTATDIHGNVSTCTSTVTVEDNIAPVLFCSGDLDRVVRNTTCTYVVEDFIAVSTPWDNCSMDDLVITQSPAAGDEIVLDNSSVTVTVTATDASSNTSICSFEVSARCVQELDIPQFMSPDGSGENDTWDIPELANYPNNVVKIFSRWGVLVMEEKGYSTGWDGSSNVNRGVNRLIDNKMLPEGTYYYIIDLGDSSIKPYTGYFQLKR